MNFFNKQIIIKFQTIIFIGIFFILFAFLGQNEVSANRGPIIDEIMFEFENVNPGDKITRSYTVTHDYDLLSDGTAPIVSFEVDAVDFMQRPEDGKPIFSDDVEIPEQLKMSNWITLEPTNFILSEKGQSQIIIVNIQVPENAKAGGRYGSIQLKPQFVDKEDLSSDGKTLITQSTAQAALATELNTLIFLTVNGDIVIDLQIIDFHIENLEGKKGNIFFNPPVKAVVTFQNNGTVHLAPRGIIFFHNGKDEIEAKLKADYTTQINNELTYILPGSTRKYEYVWNPESFIYTEAIRIHGNENISLKPTDLQYDDYPYKETKYSTKFDFDNINNIRFGKYTASIQFSADNDDSFDDLQVMSENVAFYFIPVQLIVPIIILFFLFTIAIFLAGRRAKKKHHAENVSVVENNQSPTQGLDTTIPQPIV